MPYITSRQRAVLKSLRLPATDAGELNFLFTTTALEYLKYKGECYQTYNDILGALEGAKLEMYRRRTAGYEDKKIAENGDVY